MRSVNKIHLVGNVGQDPDIRVAMNGNKVAKFSLATSEQWNDRAGQKQEKTQWHRCTCFGKLADVVEQYVYKGDRLYVDGKVEYSTTEADGITRYWTDIIVRDLVMLGTSGSGDEPRGRLPASRPTTTTTPGSTPTRGHPTVPEDDLPF